MARFTPAQKAAQFAFTTVLVALGITAGFKAGQAGGDWRRDTAREEGWAVDSVVEVPRNWKGPSNMNGTVEYDKSTIEGYKTR